MWQSGKVARVEIEPVMFTRERETHTQIVDLGCCQPRSQIKVLEQAAKQ